MPDDPEVLEALLAAAEGWLRERGMERMVGPADFTLNDGRGVLVEGFDRRPQHGGDRAEERSGPVAALLP